MLHLLFVCYMRCVGDISSLHLCFNVILKIAAQTGISKSSMTTPFSSTPAFTNLSSCLVAHNT